MKKLIGVLGFLIISVTVYSQNDLSIKNLLGSKSYMMEAVKNGFTLVEQDYVLKGKNGDLYGKDGKDYYGRNFYIGILLNNNLYVNNNTEPWKDEGPVKIMDSLKPEISKISYRIIKDSVSKFNEIKNISKVNNKESIHIYSIDKQNSFKSIAFEDENEDIFLIYLFDKGSGDHDISIEFRRENIRDIYNTKEKQLDLYKLNKKILGGAFFAPVISLGKIEYKVVALLGKDGENWKMVPINTKQSSNNKNLTPINK